MTAPLTRLLILIALCCPAAGVLAAEIPTEVRAVYKVYRGGLLIGHDEERFERRGDRYKIVSETHADGIASWFLRGPFLMVSEGRIVGDELQPLSYSSSRGDPARTLSARFDWEHNQIESTRRDKKEFFDLPAGTQDRLSVMYQFMLRAPVGDSVTVWMSQGKRSESYRYVKQDETTVHAAVGDFAAVHFAREARAGESKAQLWLAKERFFLPVRIVFEDRNGKFEQQLVDLTIR